MKDTLEAGLSTTRRIEVGPDRTIGFLGEALRIYSTPAMVSDIEYTCLDLIQAHLEEGESSVGMRIEADHLGATPLGQWVDVTVTVSAVDGRKVTLSAEVRDALECVGRGVHQRFVIDVARHAARLREKLDRFAESG